MIRSHQKRKQIDSATITNTLGLILGGSLVFIMAAHAADPGWWSSMGTGTQSAVMLPQVVTNSGIVTTNYVPNPSGIVLEGQLKQFTARAVDALNANLPGGAGTNLNNLVSGWSNDYATNHYGPGNINPSDYRIVNNGQLKYIGGLAWSQLAAEGFTNSTPFWLRQDTNFDGQAALLGQLKSVFNFNFPTNAPVISSGLAISGVSGQDIQYQVPACNGVLSYSSTDLPPGLSINPVTGVISGDSTSTGSYTVNITATNLIGSTTEAITLNLIGSSTTYPDLQNTSVPSSDPTLPSSVDPFSPPVASSTPPSGAPVIAEWTRIAKPGDVIVLAGEQFSSYTDQRAGEDTQFFAYAQTSAGTVSAMCPIIHADGTKAAVVLPSNFPANAEVFLWPVNSAGAGYPVAINATETWWIGPNTTTRGCSVSAYGRNLSDASGTSFTSNIYIQASDGTGTWATVTAANPYKVAFTVPSGTADGTYQVWVHNNRGGHYGWSGPLTLTVNDGTPWNTGTTYNVQTFGHAVGDGTNDDTAAIQYTFNAASTNAWSTVYFPTGTYMISNGFSAPTQVRWKGNGPTNTIIRANSVLPADMVQAGASVHDVTIQDLTLDPNNDLSSTAYQVIFAQSVNDIKFINDTIGGVGSALAYINDSNLIVIKNCKIIDAYTNGLYMPGCSQVFVDNCQIYGANDVNTMLTFVGAHEVSCSNNTAQDYNDAQSDGWAVGRFFYCSAQFGGERNMYVGNNTTIGLAVRPADGLDQNQGEQILFENGSQFSGNPVSSTSTTVTFGSIPSGALTTGSLYDAAIISGTGTGQHRTVTCWTSTGITVSPPWTIPPDTTSTVAVGGFAERIAVYQNTLQGKSDYATDVTASAGIQAASDTYDLVADGNSISQVRTGIGAWSLLEAGSVSNVMACDFFDYFTNNTITNSLNGMEINDLNNVYGTTFEGIGCFGNVFTGNTVNGMTQSGIWESLGNNPPGDQIDMNVFNNNTIANTTNAFTIPIVGQINNTILYKNNSSLGSATYSGSIGLILGSDATDSIPILRSNSYTGFQANYSGAQLPTSSLEAPSHEVSVYGDAGGSVVHGSLPLWDTGTGGLSWSVTTSSPWLTLNPSKGLTPPETGVSDLDLACNASSLTAGTYTGTVAVSANGQTRDYTVVFKVAVGP